MTSVDTCGDGLIVCPLVCLCRVSNSNAAPNLACLRNLANGVYELARARGRSQASSLNNWCKGQTFTMAYRILLS